MRLAFFGDVVGKSGRDGLSDHLPALKRDPKLDFVVVNLQYPDASSWRVSGASNTQAQSCDE